LLSQYSVDVRTRSGVTKHWTDLENVLRNRRPESNQIPTGTLDRFSNKHIPYLMPFSLYAIRRGLMAGTFGLI
jgi:hypothetical protein